MLIIPALGCQAGGPLQLEGSLLLCSEFQARQRRTIQACVSIPMFVNIGITEVLRYQLYECLRLTFVDSYADVFAFI